VKPKRVAVIFLAGLFLYLTLYTWNLRTGYLDSFSTYIGLDVASWVLSPGKWAAEESVGFWRRYVSLIGLKEENEQLAAEVQRLSLENLALKDRALATNRLERLLAFTPPQEWAREGARVVAHRMGPAGALETLLVDKGSAHGVSVDTPVMGIAGVVGRILRVGLAASTVLLLNDPNSKVAVIGEKNRSSGILAGQGPGRPLAVKYVNRSAPIEPGELLATSGLGGIFPKGLPLARVSLVERSEVSLFLTVEAEPLVDPAELEEVLLLRRIEPEQAGAGG
jgi:rod shape-determining protein MreC